MTIYVGDRIDSGGGSVGLERVTTSPGETFGQLVGAILVRTLRQNDLPPLSVAEQAGFGERLWALVIARGQPRPLARNERGEAGRMSAAETDPLVARVLGDDLADHPALAGLARQLVKACFLPEFRTCRDSYREVGPDGTCRRQQWERAKLRVSGAHCVDCPHWTALTSEQHERFLAKAWMPGRIADFASHREGFLPEDFRALRIFLHAHARREG
jgi:hypothetical protein